MGWIDKYVSISDHSPNSSIYNKPTIGFLPVAYRVSFNWTLFSWKLLHVCSASAFNVLPEENKKVFIQIKIGAICLHLLHYTGLFKYFSHITAPTIS